MALPLTSREVPVPSNRTFFLELPLIERFEACADAAYYRPAPEDWWVVVTDVAGSTQAIHRGGYKAVNAASVACVTAILNKVDRHTTPYVFGGDGVTLLVPPEACADVREALGGVSEMVTAQFGLTMRVGLVPIVRLRAAGSDVLVARYQLSNRSALAFFAGDGVALAEDWLKSGELEAIAAGSEKNVSFEGFECRWRSLKTRRDHMVAILVEAIALPAEGRPSLYAQILGEIRAIVGDWATASPAQSENLALSLSPMGVAGEAMVRSHGQGRLRMIFYTLRTWLANVGFSLFRAFAGRNNGVRNYVRDTVANSDFQKFDGLIRMVLDLSSEQFSRVEALLQRHHAAGEVLYGLHRADSALVTCMVFSREDDHVHFIDGNDGGYAVAATQLKAQRKTAQELATL